MRPPRYDDIAIQNLHIEPLVWVKTSSCSQHSLLWPWSVKGCPYRLSMTWRDQTENVVLDTSLTDEDLICEDSEAEQEKYANVVYLPINQSVMQQCHPSV